MFTKEAYRSSLAKKNKTSHLVLASYCIEILIIDHIINLLAFNRKIQHLNDFTHRETKEINLVIDGTPLVESHYNCIVYSFSGE